MRRWPTEKKMENEKIILDLCGGTGAWSKPYREAGYDVRNITLPDYDVRIYKPPENVYGILAAPPCTMFSLARTTAKKPRNLSEGMEIVKACMMIIWECRQKNKLAFWALENPMGILRQFLGKPALTFDPCDYGDPYTKRTDIWGYFDLPTKKRVEPEIFVIAGRKYSKIHAKTGNSKKSKEIRAITPKGFAEAFFRANQ